VKSNAFTLIELLVVIAIIAILAAILFPVFSSAKGAAKAAACGSNARQLAISIEMYKSDNDGVFPLAAYQDGTQTVIWHDMVDPYVRNKEVWLCPGSPLKTADAGGAPTSHFGYNADYLTTLAYDFSNANGHSAVGENSVGSPTDTVLFTASKSSVEGSWCGDEGKYLLAPSGPNSDCWGRPHAIHADMTTIAWCDTHVKRMKMSRFYTGRTPTDEYFDLE
jgi:prepilin-type N-terminal cleavage/methylation domain-containing protein